MAMTAMVKDELSRVECTKTSERKAEVTALLRFSGGLHIVGGRVVIEAELDTGSVARRLRRDISEVYGYTSGVSVLAGGNIRRGVRYLVRIAKHGEGLARQTGLVDQRGRPVRGLPPSVVSGGINDAEAAWRGAFLAHGSLTEPGRSSSLEVTCPGPEAAMALVGAARRLGIPAKAREVRGADRVVIRDGDAISALLTRMGAHDAVLAWEERRMRREVRATANRLANFDDANLRRSARAAVAASARVDPGQRRPRAPAGGRSPAAGVRSGLPRGARPARRPPDDQGRCCRTHTASPGDGRQAGEGPRHPGHRVRRHRRHARPVAPS
jgi:DNA-binding protein WhiA